MAHLFTTYNEVKERARLALLCPAPLSACSIHARIFTSRLNTSAAFSLPSELQRAPSDGLAIYFGVPSLGDSLRRDVPIGIHAHPI